MYNLKKSKKTCTDTNCSIPIIAEKSNQPVSLEDRLYKKFADNLSEVFEECLNLIPEEIINMTNNLMAMDAVESYLEKSQFDFTDEQAEYLLQYKNPLEIIVDRWFEYPKNFDAIGDVIDDILEKRDIGNKYPRMDDNLAGNETNAELRTPSVDSEYSSDIAIGDIVILKNGKRGKVDDMIRHDKYTLISGRNRELSYFSPDDTLKIFHPLLRKVRIYQIEPVNSEYAFKNYANVKAKKRVAPPAELYKVVYDGQPGTNSLDEIFRIFNVKHPESYTGRSLSVSDIIEFYDDKGSSFFYCDDIGFKRIKFRPVKIWYILLSINERDIFQPQFFTSLDEARRRMKNELLEQLGGSFDNYNKDEDYGLAETSAWANPDFNSDWKIVTITANKKMNIKPAYFGSYIQTNDKNCE